MTTFADLGVERLEVLVFHPGDVLVATISDAYSAEQVGAIKEQLLERLSAWGIDKIVVKTESVDFAVLRPESSEE